MRATRLREGVSSTLRPRTLRPREGFRSNRTHTQRHPSYPPPATRVLRFPDISPRLPRAAKMPQIAGNHQRPIQRVCVDFPWIYDNRLQDAAVRPRDRAVFARHRNAVLIMVLDSRTVCALRGRRAIDMPDQKGGGLRLRQPKTTRRSSAPCHHLFRASIQDRHQTSHRRKLKGGAPSPLRCRGRTMK